MPRNVAFLHFRRIITVHLLLTDIRGHTWPYVTKATGLHSLLSSLGQASVELQNE